MTCHRPTLTAIAAALILASPAAAQDAPAAAAGRKVERTKQGAGFAPALAAEDVPEAARGVALIAGSLAIADRLPRPDKPGLDDAAAGDATPGHRPGLADGAKEDDTAQLAPAADRPAAPSDEEAAIDEIIRHTDAPTMGATDVDGGFASPSGVPIDSDQ
jgi:hypothetical protein